MHDSDKPANFDRALAHNDADDRASRSSKRAGKRIAVVAVHGVAYHEPGSSANAVSELLLGLKDQGGNPKYGPITSETLHIPLHPLQIHEPLKPRQSVLGEKKFEALQERTSYLTQEWKSSGGTARTDTEVADDFMRLVLQDYRGTSSNNPKDARDATGYNTTRLRTARTEPPPVRERNQRGAVEGERGPEMPIYPPDVPPGSADPAKHTKTPLENFAQVDLYEMYWADLSRPKGSVLSFFQALYQLLFHFASLSRLATSTGYLENQNIWQWRALDRMQVYAVRMLTLPIPILNVLLLVTLFGAAPRLVVGLDNNDPAPKAAAIGAAMLAIVGYVIFCRFLNPKSRPWSWALQPLIFAGLLAAVAYLFGLKDSRHIVLSIEGLLLGSSILYYSVISYDDVRDGAKESAIVLYGLWIAVIILLWTWGHADSVEQATLWTMQIVLAALRVSWFFLFLFAFAASALGAWAWRKIDEKTEYERRDRARAAIRTSRFALAMPTLGILIATLALWSGLFVKTRGQKQQSGKSIAVRLLGDTIKDPLSGGKWFSFLIIDNQGVNRYLDPPSNSTSHAPNEYFQGLLVWSPTPAFPITLLLLLSVLFLLVLWVWPSVCTENEDSVPVRSGNPQSLRMGRWVSRGLDSTYIASWLAWVAAFVVPSAFILLSVGSTFENHLSFLVQTTTAILEYMGVGVTSAAVLAGLAGSGTSVLGIILDVDNYLRTSPAEATPRARIMERYVSLLRYLSEYRDPADGERYERVVIVAHSLGALISADLFRFLKVQGAMPQVEVVLFTMGNPLRQLLNRFFPYLYQWVRSNPDNSLAPFPLVAKFLSAPVIGRFDPPDPGLLGVDHWLNAYRSGDYVGRSLWLNEWYNRVDPAYSDARGTYLATDARPGRREEMCIGAGAHQHYWDQSAPDIAEKLDELIGF